MLIRTPAWCRNETIVIVHGGKCCHFPTSGILFSGFVPLVRESIIVRSVKKIRNSRFSHDHTAAMLEPLNKETAAILEGHVDHALIFG